MGGSKFLNNLRQSWLVVVEISHPKILYNKRIYSPIYSIWSLLRSALENKACAYFYKRLLSGIFCPVKKLNPLTTDLNMRISS